MKDRPYPEEVTVTVDGQDVNVTTTGNYSAHTAETADGRAGGIVKNGRLKVTRVDMDDGTKRLHQNKAFDSTPMTDEEMEEARRLRDVINEAIRQVEEELARLKEIHRDMERARKQMEQEKKEERVLSPIDTIRFGNVYEKGSGETSVVGQSFEAVHASGEEFSGTVRNIFDFGTTVCFDRHETAFFDQEDPSEAAEEVVEAVQQESEAAAGIRMDATSRQRPKRDFLSPEPGH